MARTPLETIHQADAAFNRGDLDSAVSHYAENAVLVVKRGKIVSGKPALRRALEEMLRNNQKVIEEKEHVIECADIALCSIKWRLVDKSAYGSPMDSGSFASTILRRQPDGHWQIVIDNPWGSSILGSDGNGA